MEQADTIVQIPHFYGSLKGMQKKFDNYARQDAFTGSTREEWESWKETSRETLKELLGWKYMETCDLDPRVEEVVELENGIRREKVILQVEPEVYMPMYILIPPKQNEGKQKCFLALPGHQGAGKFATALVGHIRDIDIRISKYRCITADHSFFIFVKDQNTSCRLADTHVAVRIIYGMCDISVFQEIHDLVYCHHSTVIFGFFCGSSDMRCYDRSLFSNGSRIREVRYILAYLLFF